MPKILVNSLFACLIATLLSVAEAPSESLAGASSVSAKTPARHVAMRFALAQRGDVYRYGGSGPSGWDCSGLVSTAYKRAGISLPRTAGSILGSAKTTFSANSRARWGDLVFWGAGHVEFFSHVEGKGFWSFGAHHSGTKISYRWQTWKGVRVERVAGAG
jgi:cell wall-associated NlpC family hydrolase